MRNKKAINLTLHPRILKLADRIMKPLGYSSFSAFVEALIREEYERRNGLLIVEQEQTDSDSPALSRKKKAEKQARDVQDLEHVRLLSSDSAAAKPDPRISKKPGSGEPSARGPQPGREPDTRSSPAGEADRTHLGRKSKPSSDKSS
jgi:hypothetical protein